MGHFRQIECKISVFLSFTRYWALKKMTSAYRFALCRALHTDCFPCRNAGFPLLLLHGTECLKTVCGCRKNEVRISFKRSPHFVGTKSAFGFCRITADLGRLHGDALRFVFSMKNCYICSSFCAGGQALWRKFFESGQIWSSSFTPLA